jgi:hypothetical protein
VEIGMQLTITIDLEEQDLPSYTARINHALSGLLHEADNRDLRGRYEFVYPACDFDRIPPTKTVVWVTQQD